MGIPSTLPTALWLYYTYPNKDVPLSSTKCEVTCEVCMTRLAVWDCNLIVQMGMVNLNIPLERSYDSICKKA